MELKHSFHAYQDPQCLLCSVGLGAELINSVRLWCTFGTSTFCREVLGEELVITERALEVFHLTKLHLSVTGDVPRGHHTWSLTQGKQYFDCSKVLIQGASNYWFYPCMWDMSAWKLCSKLLSCSFLCMGPYLCNSVLCHALLAFETRPLFFSKGILGGESAQRPIHL